MLEGDAVRDFDCSLVYDPIHDTDVLGKSSTGRLKTGGASNFFVCGTLRESLVTAVVTLAAGDVVENDDAIARSKAIDAGAYGGDHAGGFMAEDSRGRMRAGGNFFQVRA
ncbi:MAG TPA: hypothetical protein VFF50_14475, partial [Candidatus Deferrimicrobiaceae bacterium]|nr:hypothetical protein [Candidatus Deferrimicrobiaceae bacterium]